MLRFAVMICAGCAALPAGAECLTADSIEQGVVFRRSDGHSGFAIRKGGRISVDYAAEDGVRIDSRDTRLGIYETAMTQLMIDEAAMGAGTEFFDQDFAGKPPVPEVGKGWQGRVAVHYDADNPSIVEPLARDWTYDADFRFLPEFTGTLSGCTYRIIPVEVDFTAGTTKLAQRFVYFPELGFGLETRRDGVTAKVMTLKAH